MAKIEAALREACGKTAASLLGEFNQRKPAHNGTLNAYAMALQQLAAPTMPYLTNNQQEVFIMTQFLNSIDRQTATSIRLSGAQTWPAIVALVGHALPETLAGYQDQINLEPMELNYAQAYPHPSIDSRSRPYPS